jgi:hypothetical protein
MTDRPVAHISVEPFWSITCPHCGIVTPGVGEVLPGYIHVCGGCNKQSSVTGAALQRNRMELIHKLSEPKR